MKVKGESEVTQLYPTPSDPMDCSPPGSSIHGIFQARVLEWGAIYILLFSKFCNHLFVNYDITLQLIPSPWLALKLKQYLLTSLNHHSSMILGLELWKIEELIPPLSRVIYLFLPGHAT